MILTDSDAGEARGALAETVQAMLAKVSPTAEVVLRADAAAEGTIDKVLWERLNSELGAAGLAVPEGWGGSDASLAEVAVVAEALGVIFPPFRCSAPGSRCRRWSAAGMNPSPPAWPRCSRPVSPLLWSSTPPWSVRGPRSRVDP